MICDSRLRLFNRPLHNFTSRPMHYTRDKELRDACKDEPHHIMSEIRNDHPSPTPKRPNHLLREVFSTGAEEVRWFSIHLGMDRSEVDVHEGDCLVIWDVVSFVSVETQGDSAIEVFGGGVEDDSGHGRFVSEGSDEYDEGWTSTSGRAERRKESLGQEQ